MSTSQSPYARSIQEGPLRQGEILSGLSSIHPVIEGGDTVTADKTMRIERPYSLVISQDCDLDQDHRTRVAGAEGLPCILLLDIFEAEHLRGNSDINSGIWKRVKINDHARYHFLEQIPEGRDLSGLGLPELTIDFKHYYSLRTEEVYAHLGEGANRRSRLVSPYLEHLSVRFATYLSRVALPEPHQSA